MPEVFLPHEVIYEVERPVPIADVVASLLGTEQLLREMALLLEDCIPGLTVERIRVSVRHLSQESPFRQAFLVALLLVFQPELEKAVPIIAEQLLGMKVPAHYNTVLTLCFCMLLFYGAEAIYSQVSKKGHSKRLREQFDSIAKELAGESGIAEERIKKILEAKYGKSRLRILAQSAIGFFSPSKHQDNAPIVIGRRRIDRETVAEVPSDIEIEGSDVREVARQFKDIAIELHAQDVDNVKRGWAGVAHEISPKRLRIELEPPIKPEQIYRKSKIRGDVMLVSRKRPDGSFHPAVLHLLDIQSTE
jgi:hypothetical protein